MKFLVLAWASSIVPLALSQTARAGVPPSLSVVRTDEAAACPGRENIHDQVARYLAKSSATPREYDIEIRFAKNADGGFSALITQRTSSGISQGTRSLTDRSCTALGQAVALAVALQIDPDAVEARAPEPTPKKAPVERPYEPPLRRLENSPAVRSARKFSLSLGPIASFGLLPQPVVGVRLQADFDLSRRWALRGGARLLPEKVTDDGRFAFGLTTIDANICAAVLKGKRGTLAGCVGASAGEIHAVVFAIEPTEPGGRIWFGAEGEVSGSLTLVEPLHIDIGAGLTVPLLRQPFLVRGESTPVFQQSAVAPFARLSAGLSF